MLARSRGLKGHPFKLLVTWCFRSFAGFYCRSVNVKSVGLCVAKHAGGVCALVNASSLTLFLPGHAPGGGRTAVRPTAWASQAPGFRGGPGRAARRPWGTSKGWPSATADYPRSPCGCSFLIGGACSKSPASIGFGAASNFCGPKVRQISAKVRQKV